MKMLVLEPLVSERMIAERKRLGIDKYDEVWNGVYVMPPLANNAHQRIVMDCCLILSEVLGPSATVLPGANVSDRGDDWKQNYRCPDVVVVLDGGQAIDCDTHWLGGPDFLIEIMSPGDDTLEKLPFYAAIGVREVLVVERDTREAQLYRLVRKKLVREAQLYQLVRKKLVPVEPVVSEVVPLTFQRVESKKTGPRLEVRRTTGRKKTWLV